MARVTVYGAGAAGTALAIHLARKGEKVTVWGSRFDARVLPALRHDRSHPALTERLPDDVEVLGPDELDQAAAGSEVAVMAASSGGARSLASMVESALGEGAVVVSIAKGLEPRTRRRISEVYAEALGPRPVVVLSGPSLAPEVAEGLLTAVVGASADADALDEVARVFESDAFVVDRSDDVAGVEWGGIAKNVAAIGAGILEGMGAHRQADMKNARAALFTRSVHEIAGLIEAMGGRRETAFGLAGMGDLLVTGLGGRNRMYGEAVGMGAEPASTLTEMTGRGITVEGAESARDVHDVAAELGLHLPVHEAVHRIVHERAPTTELLEALR
ncbi:MAG: NAD(P)H-dependent glycerol-3-phosphate dehydrogenase [Actinomycetota bacterium]|nr:NAD(P)H-dependent glycerol-3-phosphate dehydrogenase [Actinomycetota bacterium]